MLRPGAPAGPRAQTSASPGAEPTRTSKSVWGMSSGSSYVQANDGFALRMWTIPGEPGEKPFTVRALASGALFTTADVLNVQPNRFDSPSRRPHEHARSTSSTGGL